MNTNRLVRPNDVNRLIAAAVVDRLFRNQLLTDPANALASGYYGEQFQLTPRERGRVLSIQAASLPEFARQLSRAR